MGVMGFEGRAAEFVKGNPQHLLSWDGISFNGKKFATCGACQTCFACRTNGSRYRIVDHCKTEEHLNNVVAIEEEDKAEKKRRRRFE